MHLGCRDRHGVTVLERMMDGGRKVATEPYPHSPSFLHKWRSLSVHFHIFIRITPFGD